MIMMYRKTYATKGSSLETPPYNIELKKVVLGLIRFPFYITDSNIASKIL